ncbi:anti-sigma factor family protein [Pinibacter aurantiacus]|uniref:Uncharacterized protein n=1 Tax=Pinibacter aurantiacus TaxID=2851599 RepID=A0A9E2S711_9BACT|nr:hypothetical protein [Pinibacter aurantiacus]MBV4357773.1 hypothetical protein [Pinibacter aurantiacus]
MKMEINRHNYEEYFLLYIDNELSVAERNAVDVFVEQNPDLHAELDALQQSLFLPEEKIVFPGIEGLFKRENAVTITADNREEYFVLYHDGELTTSEEKLVEEFVQDHPQYKVDFELIQKARLEADKAIIFENKEVLYKHEKTEKVIYFAWLRWSAAAAVIVIAGLLWFNKSNLFTGKSVERPIASVGSNQKNGAVESNPASTKIQPTTQPENVAPAGQQTENPDGIKNPSSVGITTTSEVKSRVSTDSQHTGTPSATNGNEVKNNAATNPSIAINDDPKLTSTKVEPLINDVAVNDPNVGKINEHIKPNITSATLASESNEQTTDNADLANNESSVGRKSGLRGFIRKATRVIERNANVDPEERPGIMIGNFAIATK